MEQSLPEWKIKKIRGWRRYSVIQNKAAKIVCGTIVTQQLSHCSDISRRRFRYTTWSGLFQLVMPTYWIWKNAKESELLYKLLIEKDAILEGISLGVSSYVPDRPDYAKYYDN